MDSEMKLMTSVGAAIVSALAAVILMFGSFFIVDEGERAVLVSAGQVTGVADPGFHFKMPLITSAETISTRAEIMVYENLESYTFDQQIATVEQISINYRIPADRVEEVYTEYKNPEAVVERFVGRRVNEQLEKVFGQYTAERAVRDRTSLSADISKALRDLPDYAPIEIISVEVASVAFPPEYNARINDRMAAEVEVAKMKQEVLQAEQSRLKAKEVTDAEAYAVEAKASAEAAAIKARGEAEAYAIRAKGDALRQNPELVALISAERWNGALPAQMVPGGAVPFVSLGSGK